jgi:hypothetical protein
VDVKHSVCVSARPRLFRRAVLAAFACTSVAVLGWLLWPAPEEPPDAAGRPQVATQDARLPPLPFADGPPVLGPDRAAAASPGSAEPSAAAGLSGSDSVAASRKQMPASFAAKMERFYELRWSDTHSAELQSLARALDRNLAATLASGETDPDDALLLKADLLDLLEPSATRRGELLAQWHERYLARSDADGAAASHRSEADRRREAAIVAKWQAQPSEERDPLELDEALEESRPGGGSR